MQWRFAEMTVSTCLSLGLILDVCSFEVMYECYQDFS